MSFETVVRPVVFPDIRPAPAQSQSPADDPTQGIATIHGASGQFLDLQYSWSASTSQSNPRETKRRVDVARVYQKDGDGNVNRDNYVDINVANRIWSDDANTTIKHSYTRAQEDNNIEIRQRNKIIRNPG